MWAGPEVLHCPTDTVTQVAARVLKLVYVSHSQICVPFDFV